MFYTHQIKTPSGKLKWIEVKSVSKKDKGGNLIWHCFHQDVTEIKKLEIEKNKGIFLLRRGFL